MKTLKFIASLAISALMALFVAIPVAVYAGANPLHVGVGVFAVGTAISLSNLSTKQSVAFMAVQQEFWVDIIIGNLFKENPFIDKCFDESEFVIGGSIVHIPQAGAKPNIVKNRAFGVSTAIQRTDNDVLYALDVYTSDPTTITEAESLEISYDKAQSVIQEHVDAMGETIGDELLYKWRAEGALNIVRTTGAATDSHLPGTTGTRAKFIKEDLKKARTIMDKQNLPKKDRYALVSTDMYDQLLEDSDLLKRDGVNGGEINLKDGVVLKLYGFEIMTRSNVLSYDDSAVPVAKAIGAATAATDNDAVLCWQKNQVTKAMGQIKFFEHKDNPLTFGDTYAILQKMGGRKRRGTNMGVVAIVQKRLS